MIRGHYRFRDGAQRAACARALLARVHLEVLWGDEGPTPEAEEALLEPGSPGWALLLVARMLHRGEGGISFAFLAAALGEHTTAARELVDAAKTSAEAIDAWIERERAGRAHVEGMIG